MKKIAGCFLTAAALMLSAGQVDGGFDMAGFDAAGDKGMCCDDACDASFGCDSSGCDSFGCGLGGGGKKLLGLLRESDHCFDDFISPMINPVFFEDPRTLTELRPIYLRHETPNQVGTLGAAGGTAHLFAAQFRIALTERLSLIATKDGFIVSEFDEAPLGGLIDDGWADVSAGLKYNLIRNTQTGTLASVGAVYEIPLGSRRSQQAVGDGEFNFFGTFGQRFFDGNAHWLSAAGYRLPVDDVVQSTAIHWSNQFDVRIAKQFYLVTGFAWWHWVDSADTGLGLGVSGHDLFNFSSTNVQDNNLVTQNVGMKYKPNGHFEAGVAYEFPLSEFEDIIDNRVQLDLIFRF